MKMMLKPRSVMASLFNELLQSHFLGSERKASRLFFTKTSRFDDLNTPSKI